jgi:nucleotide-binding universal stress UspA family protein
MYHRILVPTDGSRGSRNAAHAAIDLAKSHGASVIAVNVVAPIIPELMTVEGIFGPDAIVVAVPIQANIGPADEHDPEVDLELTDLESRAHKAGVAITVEQAADFSAADAIMDFANARQCDLIVMDTARYGAIMALFRCSTEQSDASGGLCPVLLVD